MITNAAMVDKMVKALRLAGDVHSLEDIINNMESGRMQGHVNGNTWAITQVHTYPRKRVVDIVYVVGELDESLEMENAIERWARQNDADMITATGREGWWGFRTPGWKKTGVTYAKELTNG